MFASIHNDYSGLGKIFNASILKNCSTLVQFSVYLVQLEEPSRVCVHTC